MLYTSLQLFINYFCQPTECSLRSGMEFLVDSQKVESLTKNHCCWLTISPDFSKITILIMLSASEGDVKISSSIEIAQANFERVMQEIEQMVSECVLQ